MSDTVKRLAVMWQRKGSMGMAPQIPVIQDALYGIYGGEWTVMDLPEKPYLAFGQANLHDQFVSDCLKHIPVAFWQGKSREEIVLTYLSAVDDAMGLLAENIASRITKEVK